MSNFKPAKGSVKNRTRKGRGNASGKGGECGRGHKGQKSRSGYSAKPGFEGGQMPLYKRVPKKRGFYNRFKTLYSVVNLSTIETVFSENDEITPDLLYEKANLKKNTKVKLLGTGKLNKKVSITVHAASKSAVEALKESGSTVVIID